jgi:hypothetical protein
MAEKKFLKLTQKGFQNYSGPISVYEFKDGVSVEPIPQHERDRLAAIMEFDEIAENGKENPAGIAQRLVVESEQRAPKKEVFAVQTAEEKIAEEKAAAEKAAGDLKKIYTEDELDQIIDDGGIAALRRVAKIWNVKNRSIPTLRQMVLDEQEKYLAEEGSRVERHKKAVEEVVRQTEAANAPAQTEDQVEDVTEDDDDADDDIIDAAVTGDLSAALSNDDDDSLGTEDKVDPTDPFETDPEAPLHKRADEEAENSRPETAEEGNA